MSDGAKEIDDAIKGLTGLFSILRGKSYAKDHYQLEISHGLYNELRDVRDALIRLRATLPAAPAGGERNWTEDAAHENGNYQCKCCECGQMFIGHKRRVLCKACSKLLAAPAQSAPGHDIEAAIERIISIRNGMTPDVEARAIVRRELAALAALKDAQS